ncbi:hypothetical protein ACFSQ7_27795 [Paenibacillus rhizoplanae]
MIDSNCTRGEHPGEMKDSLKHILFDLDGTLTDPKEGITKKRGVCA